MKHIKTQLACAVILNLIAAVSHAEHVINVLIENDLFTGTDRHYTSGVMLNYVSGVDDGPRRLRDLGVRFPGIDIDDQIHVSVSLGHEIFTPTNIRTAELLPEDRPYAGHAYLAAGFSTANHKEIETWRVALGLIGPNANGEHIQNTIHRAIDSSEAQGWQHQLDNEWVLSIAYEKKWLNRAWTASADWAIEADFIPQFNGAIGTLSNYVGLGGMFRVGQGLQNDYGPPKVRPSLPLSQFYDNALGSSWYFFVGVDGRLVAHNVFLDGNNFSSSHDVEKELFVGDLQAGFVWNNRRFRLGYTYVIRSREFKQQDERDLYGSLSLSLHF